MYSGVPQTFSYKFFKLGTMDTENNTQSAENVELLNGVFLSLEYKRE